MMSEKMLLAPQLIRAKEIGGIVYKSNNYVFEVAKSMWSFAVKVTMECRNPEVCFYEIISQLIQGSYLRIF